jgi:hypothetical protein
MKMKPPIIITALVTLAIAQSAFAGSRGSGRSSSGRSSRDSLGSYRSSTSYGAFSTKKSGLSKSYSLPSYSSRSYGGSRTKIYTPPGVQNYSTTTVRPYIKRDGSFVGPSFRSTPNRSVNDNWSTKGNFNPFTGQKGAQRLMEPGDLWKKSR